MAAEAQELLQIITHLASRPPSPTHSFISVSGAHSNTPTNLLPSAPPALPAPPAVSSHAARADYRIPLKGPPASRADTVPITSRRSQSITNPSDITREIRASNLVLHQITLQQSEINLKLNQVKTLIHKQQQSNSVCCGFTVTILLILLIVGFLIYHIFF